MIYKLNSLSNTISLFVSDFTPEDWKKVNGTGKKQLFFGRKFEPVICQSMLDEVDIWINANNKEDKMNQNSLINWDHPSRPRYWQNVYHHLDTSPAPNMAVVEIANTLLIITDDVFVKNSLQTWRVGSLQEITSYHNDDELEGVLLKFDMLQSDNRAHMFEVFVKSNMDVMGPKSIIFRSGEFQVGSDFDLKELVFRNVLNAMNEESKPVFVYSFSEADETQEEEFMMKVAWTDPAGNVAYITENFISNKSVNKENIKLELKTPLMSGIWTISVINEQNNQILGRLPFLVFPTKNNVDHKILSYQENNADYETISKLLKQTQTDRDIRYLTLNQKFSERDSIESWKKLLANDFYSLISMCHSIKDTDETKDNHENLSNHNIPHCKDTIWSSLSPDPKSSISTFDEDLELLV